MRRYFSAICVVMMAAIGSPVRAAQPVTITFEDIFNKPLDRDWLPQFTWKGVQFIGGALRRTDELGTWYQAINKNAIELQFPSGSTDISFDVDGVGGSIILFEHMPIQVWQGSIDDTLLATLPIPPPPFNVNPPKHRITVAGPASRVTIFTAWPPSGVSDFSNYIALDNIRYTPPDPEPTITFDAVLPQHARVLTHNYGAYPFPSPQQSQDGSIRVQATVTVNNQPAPGKTIHFRLIDPPDTAPYVKQAGDDTFGDNFDGPGALNGTNQTTATAVSDGSGRVSVTLNITSFAAGDNYQIEASGSANFGCGLSCAKSTVYTAWKRVYVEYNKMFRRGAYLTQDIVAGAKEIEVSDVKIFPDPPFQIRLVHAPPVAGTGSAGFYSEMVTIKKVAGPGWLAIGSKAGKLQLDPDPAAPGVLNTYHAGENVLVGNNNQTVLKPYLADAVGLVTGDRLADYFLLNSTYVPPTFGEAFVEAVWLTDAIAADADIGFQEPRLPYEGVLPYDPELDAVPEGYKSDWLARKWMRHATRSGIDRDTEPNHFIVFTGTNHPSQNGLNRVGSNFNDLWLFIRQMGNANLIGESLVHEFAHEWRVNPMYEPGVPHTAGTLPQGHCNAAFGKVLQMYSHPLICQMHDTMLGDPNSPERRDGIVGFHYLTRADGTVDSEYLRIRRRQDPVPQNEQQRPTPK